MEDFELVLKSRFPSVNDYRIRPWGRSLSRLMARRRWSRANYDDPRALRTLRRLAEHVPHDSQLYGHLRPPPLAVTR